MAGPENSNEIKERFQKAKTLIEKKETFLKDDEGKKNIEALNSTDISLDNEDESFFLNIENTPNVSVRPIKGLEITSTEEIINALKTPNKDEALRRQILAPIRDTIRTEYDQEKTHRRELALLFYKKNENDKQLKDIKEAIENLYKESSKGTAPDSNEMQIMAYLLYKNKVNSETSPLSGKDKKEISGESDSMEKMKKILEIMSKKTDSDYNKAYEKFKNSNIAEETKNQILRGLVFTCTDSFSLEGINIEGNNEEEIINYNAVFILVGGNEGKIKNLLIEKINALEDNTEKPEETGKNEDINPGELVDLTEPDQSQEQQEPETENLRKKLEELTPEAKGATLIKEIEDKEEALTAKQKKGLAVYKNCLTSNQQKTVSSKIGQLETKNFFTESDKKLNLETVGDKLVEAVKEVIINYFNKDNDSNLFMAKEINGDSLNKPEIQNLLSFIEENKIGESIKKDSNNQEETNQKIALTFYENNQKEIEQAETEGNEELLKELKNKIGKYLEKEDAEITEKTNKEKEVIDIIYRGNWLATKEKNTIINNLAQNLLKKYKDSGDSNFNEFYKSCDFPWAEARKEINEKMKEKVNTIWEIEDKKKKQRPDYASWGKAMKENPNFKIDGYDETTMKEIKKTFKKTKSYLNNNKDVLENKDIDELAAMLAINKVIFKKFRNPAKKIENLKISEQQLDKTKQDSKDSQQTEEKAEAATNINNWLGTLGWGGVAIAGGTLIACSDLLQMFGCFGLFSIELLNACGVKLVNK